MHSDEDLECFESEEDGTGSQGDLCSNELKEGNSEGGICSLCLQSAILPFLKMLRELSLCSECLLGSGRFKVICLGGLANLNNVGTAFQVNRFFN